MERTKLKELKNKIPTDLVPIIKNGLVVIVESECYEICDKGAQPSLVQIVKQAPMGAEAFRIGNPYGVAAMIMGYDNYWPVQYYRRRKCT